MLYRWRNFMGFVFLWIACPVTCRRQQTVQHHGSKGAQHYGSTTTHSCFLLDSSCYQIFINNITISNSWVVFLAHHLSHRPPMENKEFLSETTVGSRTRGTLLGVHTLVYSEGCHFDIMPSCTRTDTHTHTHTHARTVMRWPGSCPNYLGCRVLGVHI